MHLPQPDYTKLWPRSWPRNGGRISQGVTYCSPVHSQESRKGSALPVNQISAVRIPLGQSKQTKFWSTFSSWQTTTFLRISITISTEFPNYQNHSRQRCPRSTGNLRSLSCLKIFFERASKFKISWLKMTESTTSIPWWGQMRYKQFKTLMAEPERTCEKLRQFSKRGTLNPNKWRQRNTNSRNLSSIQQIKS